MILSILTKITLVSGQIKKRRLTANVKITLILFCDADVAKLIMDDLMSDIGAHGNPLPSRSVRLNTPSPLNPFGSVTCLHSQESMDEQRIALRTRQMEALEESKNATGTSSPQCSTNYMFSYFS